MRKNAVCPCKREREHPRICNYDFCCSPRPSFTKIQRKSSSSLCAPGRDGESRRMDVPSIRILCPTQSPKTMICFSTLDNVRYIPTYLSLESSCPIPHHQSSKRLSSVIGGGRHTWSGARDDKREGEDARLSMRRDSLPPTASFRLCLRILRLQVQL